MGQYRMTVVGWGPHHTGERDNPLDADRLLDRFRRDLLAGGHSVVEVSFEEVAPDEPAEEDDDQGDENENEVTGPGPGGA